jgi:hypothetical protein
MLSLLLKHDMLMLEIFSLEFFFDLSYQADDNRINRNQEPQYIVQGRFDRINQHPVKFPPVISRVPVLC